MKNNNCLGLNKLFLSIVLLVFISNVSAQTKIEIGEKHQLFSTILNESREYWVALPKNYNDTVYAPEKYPVVYFLDGDRHFHSLTGIQDFLREGAYASVPEMIFVGILNTNRGRDLTPTKVVKSQLGNRFSFPKSGGNENFMNFIETELMSKINSTYRTNGYKIFIGHSFGGLTVLNTMLSKRNLFNSYIAIDPSVWWDNSYVLNKAKTTLEETNFKGTLLYFAEAYTKPTPQDTARWHERAIKAFVNELELHTENKLKWDYRFFKGDDHGTVSLPAEYFGLKYIFSGYQLPVKMVANNPKIVKETFDALSKKMNFEVKPSESRIDWIASFCFRSNRTQDALELLELNQYYYPKSSHTYEVLGDYYIKSNDFINAKIQYEKALRISPLSEEIKEKLNKLH